MFTGLFFIIGVGSTVLLVMANRRKVRLNSNWETVGTVSMYAAGVAYAAALLLFSAGFTTGGVV